MYILTGAKFARVWAMFLLIAFTCQAVGASSYMHMNAKVDPEDKPATHSHCHEDMEQSQSGNITEKPKSNFGSCCDNGCTMTACHAISAITNTQLVPQALFNTPSLHSYLHQRFVLAPLSSLYRPPILG